MDKGKGSGEVSGDVGYDLRWGWVGAPTWQEFARLPVPTFLFRIACVNTSSRHVKSWVNYPVDTHLVRESGRQFSRDGILEQNGGQNRIRRGQISLQTMLQPCERCLALQLRIAKNSTSSQRRCQKRPKKTLFFPSRQLRLRKALVMRIFVPERTCTKLAVGGGQGPAA